MRYTASETVVTIRIGLSVVNYKAEVRNSRDLDGYRKPTERSEIDKHPKTDSGGKLAKEIK